MGALYPAAAALIRAPPDAARSGEGAGLVVGRGGNGRAMPSLVLGPMLRYVSPEEATIWVETDAPCTVTVLGTSTPTFCVSGHHYALVVLDGLRPGTSVEYTVALDGRTCWPDPSSPLPPSRIRVPTADATHQRIV